MQLEEFRETLGSDHPPHGLAAPLNALWHDGHGDWKRAHEIVQAERSQAAERVHAYLHRKEGDLSNADYWYARAHEERAQITLDAEWQDLVQRFLGEEK
jgi:hypothetical protein